MTNATYPIGNALGLLPGASIGKISGSIKKVFPRKTFPSKFKQGATSGVQRVVLEVPNAGTIKAEFWDHAEFPQSVIGKYIDVTSLKEGAIQYKINEYEVQGVGKSEETLKVSKQVNVEGVTLGDYVAPTLFVEGTTKAPVDAPKQSLDDLLVRVVEVHKLVYKHVTEAYSDTELTPEAKQAFISSVFIEANKHGALHLPIEGLDKKKDLSQKVVTVDKPVATPVLSNDTIDSTLIEEEEYSSKPVELTPGNWACAVVPSGTRAGKKLAEVGPEFILSLYKFYNDKPDTLFKQCVSQAVKDLGLEKAAYAMTLFDADKVEGMPVAATEEEEVQW